MKYMKYILPLFIVCLTIGYAAINVTLSITGDAYIASDFDDLNVYISNLELNWSSNPLILTSATSFEASYPVLDGEDYFIIELTNASKSFDVEVQLVCESSSVFYEPDFIIPTDGKMPVTINARSSALFEFEIVYWGAYETRDQIEISCNFEVTPIERNEYGEGDVPDAANPWKVGNEITFDTEKFNVVWSTEDTVTLLAQYNLGTDYRQTETINHVTFSNRNGWAYTPGPKEIDIQAYDGNAKTYVNEYVNYLKGKTGDSSLTGDFLTLTELKDLGCTISSDYTWQEDIGCSSSIYSKWLINNQDWYLKSADPEWDKAVWSVSPQGEYIDPFYNVDYAGIRPIITISKEAILNFVPKTLIEFSIEDVTYYAEEGMYWSDWVHSAYNTDNYSLSFDALNFRVHHDIDLCYVNDNKSADTQIIANHNYVNVCENWIT